MIDTATGLGFTPLHFAAREGCEENVLFLLQEGADINASANIDYISPLHVAVWYGHIRIVSILIDAGAVLTVTRKGHSADALAAINNRQHIVSLLRSQRPAPIEQVESHFSMLSGLEQSISLGNLEACNVLIQQGALDHGLLPCGCTPLIRALCSRQPRIVDLLISHGVSNDSAVCPDELSYFEVLPPIQRPLAAHFAVCDSVFNSTLEKLLEKYLPPFSAEESMPELHKHWAWSPMSLLYLAIDINEDVFDIIDIIDIIVSHLQTHWKTYA